MATIAIISFRLGGTDGVAIEASKWAGALVSLGHEVITVAGEGSPDRIVSGLAIGDPEGPSFAEVRSAIADADVVIVENLVSLPLNLAARNVVYDALEGRRAIFRHHDLAADIDGIDAESLGFPSAGFDPVGGRNMGMDARQGLGRERRRIIKQLAATERAEAGVKVIETGRGQFQSHHLLVKHRFNHLQ